MSESLSRAASRASFEAQASCTTSLSLPSHRDGSIDVRRRDSYGLPTADQEERTQSSRVAQPAVGLSHDPQEGHLGTQGLTTLGLGDDTPTALGCISTPGDARHSVRTNSLTGCGEPKPADLQLGTETTHAPGMDVIVNPTGDSTDYLSCVINQAGSTANININLDDGRDDSTMHARRRPLLPAPNETIYDGTVNNFYDTMMVNSRARGIITFLVPITFYEHEFTLSLSRAPDFTTKFYEPTALRSNSTMISTEPSPRRLGRYSCNR